MSNLTSWEVMEETFPFLGYFAWSAMKKANSVTEAKVELQRVYGQSVHYCLRATGFNTLEQISKIDAEYRSLLRILEKHFKLTKEKEAHTA